MQDGDLTGVKISMLMCVCVYVSMFACCLLLQILFELFGVREFFPNNDVFRALASHLCNHHIASYLCENFVFLISGFDERQMNLVST